MRSLALAIAMAFAVSAAPSSVVGQEKRKDGGSGTVKGQAEQPANPKHVEPESSSHNAEKPKPSQPAAPEPSPKKSEREPAAKK